MTFRMVAVSARWWSEVADAYGLVDVPRHVFQRIPNPWFLR